MSASSSSSADLSLLIPYLSSNSCLHPYLDRCSRSREGIFIFTAFSITNIVLLVPLSILILYLGYQRWRRQRSVPTVAMASHSDIFTYNMVALELIEAFACLLYCVGVHIGLQIVVDIGCALLVTAMAIKIQFHTLTCVDLYLAVVHPITYLGLKNKSAIRIRNIGIGCVWLLFFLLAGVMVVARVEVITMTYFFSTSIAFVIISFCSLSVLYTLRRPRPGEENRKHDDKVKQRAFHTITSILITLVLATAGILVGTVVSGLTLLSYSVRCVVLTSVTWLNLPSSMVLPLLFLHRAGKLPGCKNNPESG